MTVVGAGTLFVVSGGDFRVEQPVVRSVETEFGHVSEDSTAVESRMVVDNPNDRGFPAAATLDYRIYMNDVRMSEGAERGIGLGPGRNEVNFTAALDNGKVPAWWVTHVNGGERTVVSTRARVEVLAFGSSLPPRNRTIETGVLDALAGDAPTDRVTVADHDILTVSDRRADWGTANAERTPIAFSADLENVHNRTVRLDGTEYRIVMNGVVVGTGTTDDTITLAPGESGTFTSNAALDTPRMEAWWRTHLRQDQTTEVRVEIFGLARDDGELKRVPLSVFDRRLRLETDFLGEEESRQERLPVEGGAAPEFGEPRVTDTTSRWGEATAETTEIRTTVDLTNPNGPATNDLLSLAVDRTTTVNGVRFAENSSTVERLPRGDGSFTVTADADNDAVPRWWSRHINNGERSTVRTNATGTADIAVTRLPVSLPDRQTVSETDIVGQVATTNDSRVTTRDGRHVATIAEVDAEWGVSDRQSAPMVVTVAVRNENALSSITIERLDYVVDLNGVTVADDASIRSYTIAPGATRRISYVVSIDNQRMDEWWPTHVRNDEVTRMTSNTSVVVDTPRGEDRANVDIFGDGATIETDLLGSEAPATDGASLAPPGAATAD
jgi:LEA14-like dessication related protein